VNPNKALWEKGDFTHIAESMRESGETLVKKLGITKGLKVLDLGCGDGTTALPEARLGADVLGVDIATNLVEAGNKRAKEEGLTNCKFQEGDASNLHELKDHTFDLVVSIFGAMFAPKPFDVAKEMVRVTRPGGRIIVGNWIPNDPTLVAQVLKISSSYVSANRTPSCARLRVISMLRHDATFNEGTCKMAKAGFRASAKREECGGVLPRAGSMPSSRTARRERSQPVSFRQMSKNRQQFSSRRRKPFLTKCL